MLLFSSFQPKNLSCIKMKEKMSVYNLDGDDKLSQASVENLEKEYKLPKFLKNRIINSPYLSDQDLASVRRKRDENSNIIPIED